MVHDVKTALDLQKQRTSVLLHEREACAVDVCVIVICKAYLMGGNDVLYSLKIPFAVFYAVLARCLRRRRSSEHADNHNHTKSFQHKREPLPPLFLASE
ncbi:MAG: hypothetical protein AAGA71_06170 [Pseudomonadota bacterium]